MKLLGTYQPQATPRAKRGAPRGTYSRTTPETELLVCADYRSGMTLKRIAVLRNVRQSSINEILDKHEVRSARAR